MTIKEFARLCDCNPQTLRYYDNIDLLKPVNVDSWTGYRYYDETQAKTFVKIRNLQKAGFSIDEIRALLPQDDLAIAMAFEEKISEAEAHLQEIKSIRMSYLNDMNTINDKINQMRDRILSDTRNYNPAEEFGLGGEQYREILGKIEDCMKTAMDSIPELPDFTEALANGIPAAPAEQPDYRTNPTYRIVFEKHGWTNVKDFLDEFSDLESGEYVLDFTVLADKHANSIPFSNTLLMLLLSKNEGKSTTIRCDVEKSVDGQNHMRLWKKVNA